MISPTADEFRVFSAYILNLTGIALDISKTYLLEHRLAGLLQELGCQTFSELYYKAQADASKGIARKVIDCITTGETLFFRDAAPFEMLQHKVIPDLIDRRTKSMKLLPIPLRIWSAACSTGQEVYTIAMVLKEMLSDISKYSIRLIGTDISDAAITRASYGLYSQFEVERGLPSEKLRRFFTPVQGGWKIRDEIRSMAGFQKINLMENIAPLGKFDIIFCRNVAIYFKEEDKAKLFRKLSLMLEPDGYLIIGSTESLSGIAPQFESFRHVRSVYYQLKK